MVKRLLSGSLYLLSLLLTPHPIQAWVELIPQTSRATAIASSTAEPSGRYISEIVTLTELFSEDFPISLQLNRHSEGDVFGIGEAFSLSFTADRDCQAFLISLDSFKHLYRLFPNKWNSNSFLKGKTEILVPPSTASYSMIAGGPPGTDLVFLVAISGSAESLNKAAIQNLGPFAQFENLASASDVIATLIERTPDRTVSICPVAIHTRGAEPGEGAFGIAVQEGWVVKAWLDRSRYQSGEVVFPRLQSSQPCQLIGIEQTLADKTASCSLLESLDVPLQPQRIHILPGSENPWLLRANGPAGKTHLTFRFRTTEGKTLSVGFYIDIEGPALPVSPTGSVSVPQNIVQAATTPPVLPSTTVVLPQIIASPTLFLPASAPLASALSSPPVTLPSVATTAPPTLQASTTSPSFSGNPTPALEVPSFKALPIPPLLPDTVFTIQRFHEATKKGNIENVRLWLATAPWLVTSKGDREATPLHWAAATGNTAMLSLLASAGANVIALADGQMTPLHLAALAGQESSVANLVSTGAAINARNSFQETPLILAVKNLHLSTAQFLLKVGAQCNIRDANGNTALDWAELNKLEGLIRQLTAAGAKKGLDLETSTAGLSSLPAAILALDRLRVETFLTSGTASNSADSLDNDLRTPLHTALLPEIEPLATASPTEWLAIVQAIAGKSTDLKRKDAFGMTPILLASERGSLAVVRFLAEHGAGLQGTTLDGQTLMHLAARHGDPDLLDWLAKNGVSLDSIVPLTGLTPLAAAAQSGNSRALGWFLEKGVPLSATRDGSTPLHLAAESGSEETVALLLKSGQPVDSTDLERETPLHRALRKGHATIVSQLLENGASPHAVTLEGFSPLHFAARQGTPTLLELLVKRTAKLHIPDSQGNTPLMTAVESGNTAAVAYLLKTGANGLSANRQKKTAIDLAREAGFEDIIGLLEKPTEGNKR